MNSPPHSPMHWTARLLPAILLMILAEAPLPAQGIWGVGSGVYAKNCANVYCHGAKGAAGAAPAVAGKALSPEQVNRIVREGIPDTSMAGMEGHVIGRGPGVGDRIRRRSPKEQGLQARRVGPQSVLAHALGETAFLRCRPHSALRLLP